MNTNKSKVMMFEKGRRTFYEFFIYNRNIDIVDNFKYLGLKMATGIEAKMYFTTCFVRSI